MLKGSGNYLRNQTLKNLAKTIAFLLLLSGIGLFLFFRLLTASVGILEEALAVVALVPLAGFFIYLRKYHVYLSGWNGEKSVTNLLRSTLSDDYLLVNSVTFRGGHGDVDHIVLGPNGVFALETKNWSGKIACEGDMWQRPGGPRSATSPSEQAKRNAIRVRHAIENSKKLSFNVWVEPIVVFTNKHTELYVNRPTVTIIKLPQLPSNITSFQNRNGVHDYTEEQLEQIRKEITRQVR
jgi:hypothetical protein